MTENILSLTKRYLDGNIIVIEVDPLLRYKKEFKTEDNAKIAFKNMPNRISREWVRNNGYKFIVK